jgi:hypothetical protein
MVSERYSMDVMNNFVDIPVESNQRTGTLLRKSISSIPHVFTYIFELNLCAPSEIFQTKLLNL